MRALSAETPQPWWPRERETLRGEVVRVEGELAEGLLVFVRREDDARVLVVDGSQPAIKRHLVLKPPEVGDPIEVKRLRDGRTGGRSFRVRNRADRKGRG